MDNLLTNKELDYIKNTCAEYNIEGYKINSDGSIDVTGDVDLFSNSLTKLPLSFRNVSGNFYCNMNKLTSLVGAPLTVGGHFYCSYNKLTSLEGAPTTVGENFHCRSNELPNEFTNYFDSLTEEEKSIFLKYQNEYDVWTPELNLNNLAGFIEDIKDGLR